MNQGKQRVTLHDFTTDASALRQVLAGYESKSSRQLDNSELADPSLNTPNPSAPVGQVSEGSRWIHNRRCPPG